ncbi:flavin mononucleotide phosphatase [Sporomusa ovata DSM 2662]|uniref:FIG001553: Hydrolase, HAD subfamily IIIA n=1 Tax=Sporomusa ovata TaxID=2378 RepID=A0A0U1KVC5_9FIRM|nr:YqeG family HAD IIIA-type phosphatase [Sporomusa ovata]EQB29199.1 HAD superfamily phosphatase, TIGR01668 [Sporomusa ovata DSM 2662]CQR71235.1 FIG001553: Hydrolase, HAD subfamily IIIA [Sporomusa ovata]
MLKLLVPCMVVNTLYDIKLTELKQQGIRGIVFDIDNTIIPWNSPDICPEVLAWLNYLAAQDFKLCFVSNNGNRRVSKIAEQCGIPFVARALKPLRSGFRQAAHTMGLHPETVAVVGDQLFTDILGGNRLGMVTIWVKPLTTKEFIGTKVSRQLEKLAVYILKVTGRL